MKELKGQKRLFCAVFLGFGCILPGTSADRANLLRSQDGLFHPVVLNHSPIRDPNAGLLFGFGHRVAFGSRLPILL